MAPAINNEEVRKVARLIDGIRIAMLTTVDSDGALRSRPMATQEEDFDGSLWFFTKEHSGKASQLQAHQKVSVTYEDTHRQHYVALSGVADIIHDRDKIKELWRPWYTMWFPDGIDDPEIALMKVTVETAEYWSAPTGIAGLAAELRSAVTGSAYAAGDHDKVLL